MSAIHVLLRHSIDYAGLFPPAGLGMKAAVENYGEYRNSRAAWALGRFVVPADRLPEFEATAQPHFVGSASSPWQLSALLGADLDRDLATMDDFNRRQKSGSAATAVVDSVELKAGSAAAAEAAMSRIPRHLQAYIEIPSTGDPSGLIGAVARLGARAKVRTGGITPEAFPGTDDLLRFMAACIRAGVPFKATAGLHHPLRAEYRLTYEAAAPSGMMFGFLNLFLASAFLHRGLGEGSVHRVLEEGSVEAFQVDDAAISWRSHRLTLPDLRQARDQALVSFGSCSFTEPLEELQALHLLDVRVPQA
jgi:hypothetical protein